jgi:hypothetical protein
MFATLASSLALLPERSSNPRLLISCPWLMLKFDIFFVVETTTSMLTDPVLDDSILPEKVVAPEPMETAFVLERAILPEKVVAPAPMMVTAAVLEDSISEKVVVPKSQC